MRKHFDFADRDVEEISRSTRRIVRSGEKVREVRLEDEAEDGAGLPLEPPPGSA